MQASSEVDQATIIAVGFTRPEALLRLLESINNSDLPSATRLLISLDGGASQKTIQTARDFVFAHGEKEVKLHSTKSQSAEQSVDSESSPVLFLAESQYVLENTTQFMRLAQYYSYQRLDATDFGLRYFLMFARKLFGRMWRR